MQMRRDEPPLPEGTLILINLPQTYLLLPKLAIIISPACPCMPSSVSLNVQDGAEETSSPAEMRGRVGGIRTIAQQPDRRSGESEPVAGAKALSGFRLTAGQPHK